MGNQKTQRRVRIALVTSVIDHRSARGTALVARRLLERIGDYPELELTLIHHSKTDDPLYTKYPELIIPELQFPFNRQMFREIIFWIRVWISGSRFDIVHYLNPRVWPSYLLSNGRNVVVTAHEAGVMLGLHRPHIGDLIFRLTNRFLHQRMHALIAVSEFGKQEIVEHYHVKPSRVHVIYNAVDSWFRRSKEADLPGYLASHYGIPSPFILSVGRLDPHKNIQRLVRAYGQCVSTGMTEKLVLVGGRHMPEYSQQIDRLVSELNLVDCIHIAPFIPEEDLPKVYSAATAVVYPSLHEGFGLPIVEAFACETPIAVSNTTALPEIAGGAALLFDPYDINAIASAIQRVVTDQDLRQELVANGSTRIKEFSWDIMTAHVVALYRRLAS